MDASLLSPHLLPDDQLTRDNCKEYLSRFLGWLHARFDAGDNIIELVATRSEYMDQLLCRLWQKFGFDKSDLTLIAVGGYGRGELHPHSDIDLLILYDGDELDEVLGLRIGEFITLLWDLKLEVGQAVRNVAECLEQGRADSNQPHRGPLHHRSPGGIPATERGHRPPALLAKRSLLSRQAPGAG